MDRGQIDRYGLDEGNAMAIAPGWGCNLFSWTVDGEDLIYCPEGYPAAAVKITGGGTPLLFPAVGRTWDTSGPEPVQGAYRIHGSDRTYHIPSHGILFSCGFRKTEERRDGDRLTVAYEAILPESVRAESYPFDMAFSQRYTLSPCRVDLEATITNQGDTPAPAAFGYHPYFRISGPEREGVQVRLPVRTRILLTEKTVLPTGETEPTDGILNLRPDVYYDLGFIDPTGRRMSILDPKARRAIHVDFGEWAGLFFAYAPDGESFFCIEPWTYGLGGFEALKESGWENGKALPVYAPGETRTFGATFSVEKGGAA